MKYRKDVLLARLSLVVLVALIVGIVISVVSRVSAHKESQQKVAEVLEEETETTEIVIVDDSEFAEVIVEPEEPEEEKKNYIVTTTEVNFRRDPTTDGELIDSITSGKKLELLDEAEGWSKVIYNDETGYVNSNFVQPADDNDEYDDDEEDDIKKMITTSGIKMRTGPGSDYEEICDIDIDTVLSVFSIDNNWAKIYYNEKTGYVCADYLIEE